MYLKLPGLMIELLEKRDASGIAMDQLELEILSYSHADIGGCLLKFWKLPQSIWEPVAMHHNPAGSGEFMLTACAIHIADAWVNANRFDSSGSKFELDIDPEAPELVGVDMDAVENAARVAGEQTQAVVRQFMGH